MPKHNVKRILISCSGRRFLLCSVALLKDKYGQQFVKLSVPALLSHTLSELYLPSAQRSYETELRNVEPHQVGQHIGEFSYHLESGVVTVKGEGRHYKVVHHKPKFEDVDALHLVRIQFGDPVTLVEYTKAERPSTHVRLPFDFSNEAYLTNVVLAKGSKNVEVVNTDDRLQLVAAASIVLAEDTQCVFTFYRVPWASPREGISIFYYDDPQEVQWNPAAPGNAGDSERNTKKRLTSLAVDVQGGVHLIKPAPSLRLGWRPVGTGPAPLR